MKGIKSPILVNALIPSMIKTVTGQMKPTSIMILIGHLMKAYIPSMNPNVKSLNIKIGNLIIVTTRLMTTTKAVSKRSMTPSDSSLGVKGGSKKLPISPSSMKAN